jgi:hypothetical protein
LRVRKTFRPGAAGTRRLADRFGNSLVCVRYRHDPVTDARVTTVELIVENTRKYRPREGSAGRKRLVIQPPVWVRVGRNETALRQQVKAAGGIWRYPQMVWELPRELAIQLGLRDRVVPRDPASNQMTSGTARHSDAYPWLPRSSER